MFTHIRKSIVAVTVLLGLSTSLICTNAFAANPTGLDIMNQVDQLDDGNDQSSKAIYTLINRNNKKRIRHTVRFWKDYDGKKGVDSKMITFFQSPALVKGTGFLSWTYEEDEKDDDQWLYLPALKKERRIAASGKDNYFMGSDFTYDDMGERKVDEDSHKLLKNEIYKGVDCYVVESTPIKKGMYSRRQTWVEKKNWLIQKVDYYDRKGRLLKTLNMQWQQVKGLWTWKRGEMRNHLTKHATLIDISAVRINTGLKDRIFSIRTLKRGVKFK